MWQHRYCKLSIFNLLNVLKLLFFPFLYVFQRLNFKMVKKTTQTKIGMYIYNDKELTSRYIIKWKKSMYRCFHFCNIYIVCVCACVVSCILCIFWKDRQETVNCGGGMPHEGGNEIRDILWYTVLHCIKFYHDNDNDFFLKRPM